MQAFSGCITLIINFQWPYLESCDPVSTLVLENKGFNILYQKNECWNSIFELHSSVKYICLAGGTYVLPLSPKENKNTLKKKTIV
jgi:hypothetical protein